MSIFGRISTVVALAAAMVMVSFTAQAASPGTPALTAKVIEVNGSATVNGVQLLVGKTLTVNSVIKTSPGSTVKVDLGKDIGIVLVRSDSEVSLDKLEATSEKGKQGHSTELNVKQGGVSGNIKKLNTASKFQVKTSQGIAGIRGTNFTVYSDGSTTVFDGVVVIIFVINGVSSDPITVRAGETVTPPTTPGGIPTKIPTPANVDPGVSVVGTVNDGAATTTATVTLPQPSARVGAEFETTTEQYTPPPQNGYDL